MDDVVAIEKHDGHGLALILRVRYRKRGHAVLFDLFGLHGDGGVCIVNAGAEVHAQVG